MAAVFWDRRSQTSEEDLWSVCGDCLHWVAKAVFNNSIFIYFAKLGYQAADYESFRHLKDDGGQPS